LDILEQKIKSVSAESKIAALRAIYAKDFKLYLKNLVYSLDEHSKTGEAIKRLPDWDYLYELADDLLKYNWIFVLKSRQIMATWLLVAYELWIILFHKGKKVAFQSKKGDDADSLIQRAKIIYDKLPGWKPQADFSYCRIKIPEMYSDGFGIPQGPEQARSYTFSSFFSDEFGFQENREKTFAASKPAVDGGGQFIAITTPPEETDFVSVWEGNEVFQEPKGKFVKIHYSRRPDRDEAWKQEAKKGYTEDDWNREYELISVPRGLRRVFNCFFVTKHVNPFLIYQPGRPVLRGWDFGFVRPAVGWSQITDRDHWNDLYELLGHNEDLETFVPKIIKESNLHFPDAQFIEYVDYAGNQRSDKSKLTSIQIMRDLLKIPTNQPIYCKPRLDIEEGHKIIRNKMITMNGDRPTYQIHPSCKHSIDAYSYGYLYKADGIDIVADKGHGKEKEKDYYKHLMDARRYRMQNIYSPITGGHLNIITKLNARKTSSPISITQRLNARKVS